MRYSLLIVFFAFCSCISAQSYKDKCIEGNCRNGFGLLRVQTGTDPLPKQQTTYNNTYYYYVMGDFKNGKLNGKGCRFEVPWNFGNFKPYDEKYGQMVKDKILPKPDSSQFWWFETGNYTDNKLDGAGFLADYNYGGSLNRAYFIRQGNFNNGKLHGEGTKIYTDYATYFTWDTLTKKNRQEIKPSKTVIIHGSFANDLCVTCTKSSLSTTGVWGNITGEKLDDDFFSGWVIKDYTDSATKGNVSEGYHFIKKTPFKTLYVGGINVSREFTTELAVSIKKVDLGNGKTYEGETDVNGRPFGFGEIKSTDFYYKGFVDQGQPNGYGIYYPRGTGTVVMGGNFEYGKLVSGAAYMGGGWPKTIRCYGYTKNTSSAAFNLFTGFVYNGDYVEKNYDYDSPKRKYKLTRESNGYMINGYIESKYVWIGKTDADIVRQRIVTNGMAAFSDVVIGDVVVLNGLASPVVDNKYMRLTLLDGRYIDQSFQNNTVQLSKHKPHEFEHTCTKCNGKSFTTTTYTPPPQQVTSTYYIKETVVGDFTIWTRHVPVTTTYTKTFAPVTRQEFCTVCNGMGKQTIAKQLKE